VWCDLNVSKEVEIPNEMCKLLFLILLVVTFKMPPVRTDHRIGIRMLQRHCWILPKGNDGWEANWCTSPIFSFAKEGLLLTKIY
jgi:hypothetical protein